ncbi:hypothetical protein Asp14428_42990 [Actinoplanes sp. NBRC 14428]|nr:hypothetical protein Asp14428_42990 [Actinoplanes sp. NBRC 14428]
MSRPCTRLPSGCERGVRRQPARFGDLADFPAQAGFRCLPEVTLLVSGHPVGARASLGRGGQFSEPPPPPKRDDGGHPGLPAPLEANKPDRLRKIIPYGHGARHENVLPQGLPRRAASTGLDNEVRCGGLRGSM